MKEPATATDLQRFLGIVNFLGRHLLNFATALNSMTELLEKEGGGPGDHHNNLRLPRSKKYSRTAPTLVLHNQNKQTLSVPMPAAPEVEESFFGNMKDR